MYGNCKFRYGYVKQKYGVKTKLCYIDKDSFIVYVKIDIYKNIAEDVETRFSTSIYEFEKVTDVDVGIQKSFF